MKADLERRANRIAQSAGAGVEAEASTGSNRVRAAAFTATFEAMHAEATDRSLTRALDAGR